MEERSVIAIDGYAGSGKTTISRMLAERLGYMHLNTGLLYRAVGYLALVHSVPFDDDTALRSLLAKHRIELRRDGNSARLYIDGEDVTNSLHSPEVSEATSSTAVNPAVREALVEPQRQAFPDSNLVAEGRDMGTVIFPDATVKFFIDADPEVRVHRRLEQLYGDLRAIEPKQLESLKKEMQREIIERDKRDSERTLSPTRAAEDAITVDNSQQTLTQVVSDMYDAVANRGPGPG